MFGTPTKRKARAPRSADLAFQDEVGLAGRLYTHDASVILSHGFSLLFNAFAAARLAGPWPVVAIAAGVVAFGCRALVLHQVRRAPSGASILRWRLPYQAIGIVWGAISALVCSFCLVDGNETLRFCTILLILGITAGISSRSASAPRFALLQIVIWLLPLAVLIASLQDDRWIVAGMTLVLMLALASIVRRHHAELITMIAAERIGTMTQTALAERETALRMVFDNAAAGVNEIDVRTGRYLRVNKFFCDMLGRSETDLLAVFDTTSFTHPDDRATQAAAWVAIRDTGRTADFEKRYIRADGAIVWAHLNVSVATWDAGGRPLHLVSIVQDVTRRKATEAALRASQDLLLLSLEIGGVGTFRRDYVEGLIHCGPETRIINGLQLGDAPIPAADWTATVLTEDRLRLQKRSAEAHAAREPIVSFDYRFMHPDKGIRFAETRSLVDYDSSGRAISSTGVVIDVTERRGAERRLAHLAHHDPLTDLPNRSLFRIRLDAALEGARHGEPFAILCVDLDRFKDVNDRLGHPVGDGLLQAVTARLTGACRSTDTIARLGGDEFAVILSPLASRADATAFAEQVTQAIAAPYRIEGHHIVIGSSIGLTIAPDDGLDFDRLLRNADMALYGAKGDGRGHYCFFERAMLERQQTRQTLDDDLRQALGDGTLELFYQPIVAVATRRILGYEALIRWRHPKRGLVMPDVFIPLAQSNGLIVPIGAFVVNRACEQAALWRSDAHVAVNLSASEFTNPDLFKTIEAALNRTGLDPARLEVEITETVLLQQTQTTIETLHRLKALGIRISMDDFGTGFSSLGYLQQFPFDKVKIDRSFITPLGQTRESLAIVGAVITLCTKLDIATTAEGVETIEQVAILSELGCLEAQGYYFGRPRPAADVADLNRPAGFRPHLEVCRAEPVGRIHAAV